MAKTIITIGREYCTGGNYIAEDVANALGIKLYDKELITMAAKHSGLSEEAVAASEKRRTHSLLYSLYTMGNELPLGDQVFILQSRIINSWPRKAPASFWAAAVTMCCGSARMCCACSSTRRWNGGVSWPRPTRWSKHTTRRASRKRSKRPTATVLPTTTTTPRTAGAMPTTMIWPSTPPWAARPASR